MGFKRAVRVTIPATSGNLGSGFDCLGMAVGLYNTVDVEIDTLSPSVKKGGVVLKNIHILGEGCESISKTQDNVVFTAIKVALKKAGIHSAGVSLKLVNNIPVTRGLGSSAAARVGGITAVNAVLNDRFTTEDIINMASKLEGHPDNVVPAIVGGVCLSYIEDKKIGYIKFDKIKSKIYAITCIPGFELTTKKARAVLPKNIPMRNAVYNCARVGMVTTAFITGNLRLLDFGMRDKLHQPYRSKLIPGFYKVYAAAKRAGAMGVALSGAGPTMLAVTESKKTGSIIGERMVSAWKKYNVLASYKVLEIDDTGYRVEKV
ncbi:MAG: homoserine kinase [Elusimicrobiota bacterium]